MEQFEFVFVVIRILSDADGINLVILAANQAHGALNLERTLKAEGNALLLAEQLKFIAIYAGVFSANEHVFRLSASGLRPGNKFLEASLIIGQMLGV